MVNKLECKFCNSTNIAIVKNMITPKSTFYSKNCAACRKTEFIPYPEYQEYRKFINMVMDG